MRAQFVLSCTAAAAVSSSLSCGTMPRKSSWMRSSSKDCRRRLFEHAHEMVDVSPMHAPLFACLVRGKTIAPAHLLTNASRCPTLANACDATRKHNHDCYECSSPRNRVRWPVPCATPAIAAARVATAFAINKQEHMYSTRLASVPSTPVFARPHHRWSTCCPIAPVGLLS